MKNKLYEESLFNSPEMKNNIRERAIKGGVVTFISQGLRFAFNFVSVMIMARLLLPEDYGLVAMVTAVTSLLAEFRDLGLSAATIQQEKLTREQVNTLFWVNSLTGFVLAAAIIALAPFLADFYKEPLVFRLATVISVGFIFSGAAVQHLALLKRNLFMKRSAVIEITSVLAGIITGIASAYFKSGYWALVYAILVKEFFTMAGAWILCPWRPGLSVNFRETLTMIGFGGNITVWTVVNYFSRHLDDVLVGRFCGKKSLGFYDKAYMLLLIPLHNIREPLGRVVIPTLSRLTGDRDKYRHYFYQISKLLAYMTMPFIILAGVLSNELVYVLFGKQWAETGTLFSILSITAFFQPVQFTTVWVYISLGQTRRFRNWGCIFALIQVISFFIGLPWGVRGIAVSYSICTVLLIYPMLWAAFKDSPLNIKGFLVSIKIPFMVSLIAGTAVFFVRIYMNNYNPMTTLFISGFVAVFIWLSLFIFWRKMREEIMEYRNLVRNVYLKKQS